MITKQSSQDERLRLKLDSFSDKLDDPRMCTLSLCPATTNSWEARVLHSFTAGNICEIETVDRHFFGFSENF